jgi:hypothetical protein
MHKKPCSSVLTAASIAASKEEKIFACRADLMGCCVFVREIPLLQKNMCCSFLRGAENPSPGDLL